MTRALQTLIDEGLVRSWNQALRAFGNAPQIAAAPVEHPETGWNRRLRAAPAVAAGAYNEEEERCLCNR